MELNYQTGAEVEKESCYGIVTGAISKAFRFHYAVDPVFCLIDLVAVDELLKKVKVLKSSGGTHAGAVVDKIR